MVSQKINEFTGIPPNPDLDYEDLKNRWEMWYIEKSVKASFLCGKHPQKTS